MSKKKKLSRATQKRLDALSFVLFKKCLSFLLLWKKKKTEEKAARFARNITSKASQQHIKGRSSFWWWWWWCCGGRSFEEAHSPVTYHRSTSSLLKIKLQVFIHTQEEKRKKKKGQRIIHSHSRPHTVPFRFESARGEKNARERERERERERKRERERGGEKKKKTAFLPPPFLLPLRFQAAMPHGRSLLQATPTPSEPTGWSSALQSEEPTAGSRQLHKKQLQLDASDRK